MKTQFNENLNFTLTEDDQKKFLKIIERVEQIVPIDVYREVSAQVISTVIVDLTIAHLNGCPLNFDVLCDFCTTHFIEDIVGINNNIDLNTGKLRNGFKPRCAASINKCDIRRDTDSFVMDYELFYGDNNPTIN